MEHNGHVLALPTISGVASCQTNVAGFVLTHKSTQPAIMLLRGRGHEMRVLRHSRPKRMSACAFI
eukprot:354232-Chlamydomonas_euryale.AAC.5